MRSKLILFFVLTLSLVFFVSAQEGCFITTDSPYHCQDIEKEIAQQECSEIENCVLTNVFYDSTPCNALDSCHQILCKATCSYGSRSDCASGEVPIGEELLWCPEQGGCCNIQTSDQQSCTSVKTKGECEIIARNKGVFSYGYIHDIDATSCQTTCGSGLGQFTTEKVKNPPKIIPEKPQQPVIPAINLETKTNDSPIVLITLLIIILITIALFFIPSVRTKAHNFLEKFFTGTSSVKQQKKDIFATSENLFNPPIAQQQDFELPKTQSKKHIRNVKRHRREEFLTQIGLDKDASSQDVFTKVNQIVHKHKLNAKPEEIISLDKALENLKQTKKAQEKQKVLDELKKIVEK